MSKKQIGIVGLGVMGRSIALNFVSKGFNVVGYNRSPDRMKSFVDEAKNAHGVETLEGLVNSLAKPRVILLMVPAGEAVDKAISDLMNFLDQGDILIDGGNSLFRDTHRRESYCNLKGITWLGLGVSGGEEGALKGPSMMLGGEESVARKILPLLAEVAAQTPEPCIAYLGKGGAGHFVKMVHNGIEYAEMQAIAEIYYLAKYLYKLDDSLILKSFQKIYKSELTSFLIEITIDILQQNDDLSSDLLLDKISDRAKSKGTGRWTVEYALLEAVGSSTITAALDGRIISSMVEKREAIRNRYGERRENIIQIHNFDEVLEKLLFFSKMMIYSQGVDLLKTAKKIEGYSYNLSDVFKIWRNGCIIRSELLDPMSTALETNDELLLDHNFSLKIEKSIADVRKCIIHATEAGIATPVLTSSLQYYDMLRAGLLPTNLIQAQRDYFGAHLYERIDKDGQFHTKWSRTC